MLPGLRLLRSLTATRLVDADIQVEPMLAELTSGGWDEENHNSSVRGSTTALGPLPIYTFAGRFGTAPGAGILTIDRGGTGRFYAPLESCVGARPDWTSTFRY